MEQFSKQKALDIQPGLFLVRYESADNPVHPPKVAVSVESGSESSIELICPPDVDDAVLWSPGACLVVRAARRGRLQIEVTPTEPDGSVAAQVQLVTLSADPGGLKELGNDSTELDLSGFRVMGHVAGLGDVFAAPQEWIAGPTAPSRIEGFAIEWPERPKNITVRYAVNVGGPRPTTSQMVEAGNFAGTRGRALPLVGANVEILGRGAAAYQLIVDAIFLGSPQMRVSGQRVILSGPTGREPLVGLRVGIGLSDQPKQNQAAVATPRPKAAVAEPVKVAPKAAPASGDRTAKRAGRVRVFRSSASEKK